MKTNVNIFLIRMCSYLHDTSAFRDTSHCIQSDASSQRNKFQVPVQCNQTARTWAHNLFPSDIPGLLHINNGFNTSIHHYRITQVPEHKGKRYSIELSPCRAEFFGSNNASEYLGYKRTDLFKLTNMYLAAFNTYFAITSTSPKTTLHLPHSHTANIPQRSCLATGVLLPAVSDKRALYRKNLESLWVSRTGTSYSLSLHV